MLLYLKSLLACSLLLTVVEMARLPSKIINDNIPVLKVLQRDGFLSPNNVTSLSSSLFLFEQQTVHTMKNFDTNLSLVSLLLHPNVTEDVHPINQPHSERTRMKRTPQCVKNPVARCERDRLPKCLVNVGCNGAGSCGGTCREVRIPLSVLRFKGNYNGNAIWQHEVIQLSTDCVCT